VNGGTTVAERWVAAALGLLLGGGALYGGAPAAAEPVVAGPVLAAAVTPVTVPPAAPFEVRVSARALAGQPVEVQAYTHGRWAAAYRRTLSLDGTATVATARTGPGTYLFRAVRVGPEGTGLASDPVRLVVTAAGYGDPRAYRFLVTDRGTPARWNPCGEVRYRVNDEAAPEDSERDLAEALRRITYETGLRFRRLGETKQVPGSPAFRYDADVVVAWAHAKESRYLGGTTAGVGGFERPVRGKGGRPRIVRGFVVLDTDLMNAMPEGYGAGRTRGQALLHELGHLVGLDHVTADRQIMRPVLADLPATLYGAGDLSGLRRLGRQSGCV
jgi:hypothetical protein